MLRRFPYLRTLATVCILSLTPCRWRLCCLLLSAQGRGKSDTLLTLCRHFHACILLSVLACTSYAGVQVSIL